MFFKSLILEDKFNVFKSFKQIYDICDPLIKTQWGKKIKNQLIKTFTHKTDKKLFQVKQQDQHQKKQIKLKKKKYLPFPACWMYYCLNVN